MSVKSQGVRVSMAEKRAGDDDRKAVAEQLRNALEQGRLELDEYDERVQTAYQAKTYGELDALLVDLPGVAPVGESQLEPVSARVDKHSDEEDDEEDTWEDIRGMWTGWGFLAVVLIGIWGIGFIAGNGDGGEAYFWPIWPLGFTALGMGVATFAKLFNR